MLRFKGLCHCKLPIDADVPATRGAKNQSLVNQREGICATLAMAKEVSGRTRNTMRSSETALFVARQDLRRRTIIRANRNDAL